MTADRARSRRVPVFSATDVEEAVSPERALEAVRDAFVAYSRGEWSMPPKVYVPAYPAGDFRAMPALGGGHALLKWVTSYPGNPAQGLPTVMGLVLLSDASNGTLRAVLDAGAVTALRTGGAAVLAAETLGRSDAETAAVVGAGVNGVAAAKTFLARGRQVFLYDVDPERAKRAAAEIGAQAANRDDALRVDVVEEDLWPRARNVLAAAIPFTPAPTTAAVSASERPSVSAASTAAAPVRSAVTAPASRAARSDPFDASERRTSPITVGSPCAGLPGKDVTHLRRACPASERGHRAEVPGGIRGHVDLRRHRPLAARICHERVADGLERALGRDAALNLLVAEKTGI